MRHGVLGLVVLALGCGGDGSSTGSVDAATDASVDTILPPDPDAAPFPLPEGLRPISEMRVGMSGCGSSSFTLTIGVTKIATGFEVVHNGASQCSGLKLQCANERLQIVIDGFGVVTQTTLISGTCVYSTDINDTPRAVEQRSYGLTTGRLTENIKLEGTDFPSSGSFVF